MANVLITPATMSLNGYVYGNSTTVGSTAAIFNPTTANTYQIRFDLPVDGKSAGPCDGKIGILVSAVYASSSSFIRVQVAQSASSDYLGWEPARMSSDVTTFYMPKTSADFTAAASSTDYMFIGPFESAKYARYSTAGYKVMNLTVDAVQIPQASGSSLSTTFSVTCTTIKCIAFQMP
jgi:hypothetical protein